MERRKFLQNAGIAGILAAGVAPAVHAQGAPAIRWRLASSFPKALDTIYGAAEVFAKSVSEATGGKFTISVHAGGELMPPFGVVDGVQQGTVECAHTAPYYFFGKDDTFAIDCAIPFGLNSRQMTAWMYEGNGLKLLRLNRSRIFNDRKMSRTVTLILFFLNRLRYLHFTPPPKLRVKVFGFLKICPRDGTARLSFIRQYIGRAWSIPIPSCICPYSI